MKRTLAMLAVAGLAWAGPTRAVAGDEGWATAGKILTGVMAGHVLAHALAPGPVYYYAPPPPVLVAPPVYAVPAPVVVAPPVVYAPPPVRVCRPPVVSFHFGYHPGPYPPRYPHHRPIHPHHR